MPDVAAAIRDFLLTETAVTDVVSQRVYADKLPQGATVPAIEMTIVSDVPDMELSDISGLTKARVQLNCLADGNGARGITRALAKAIRTCGIATIKGLYSGVWIRGVAIDSQFDSDIAAKDGSDENRKQTSVDLIVAYMEQ